MSVVSPPEQPRPDELELLIPEARARQRRRRLGAAALLALAAGTALAVYAIVPAGHRAARTDHGAPAALASPPRCLPAQLRAGKPSFDGAYTAHVVENLALTNVSAGSCALRGRPAFEVVLPGGRRVVARVGHVRNTRPRGDLRVPPRDLVLRPGGAASFHVIADDGTGLDGICPLPLPTARVLVVPPGASSPARGAVKMPYCHDPRRLLVMLSPLVSGRFDPYSFQ